MWKCPENAGSIASLNSKAYSLGEKRTSPWVNLCDNIRPIYAIILLTYLN